MQNAFLSHSQENLATIKADIPEEIMLKIGRLVASMPRSTHDSLVVERGVRLWVNDDAEDKRKQQVFPKYRKH